MSKANDKRVDNARKAVSLAKGRDKLDPESMIVDTLTDIMHLCDADTLCFPDLLGRAYGHYTEERYN